MSDSEWLKLSSEEINIIASSLEISKKFLSKVVDDDIKKGIANEETDGAKQMLALIDKLLVKLE